MYNIIKREIANGRKLTEVNRMIDVAMGAGTITDAQYTELRNAAQAAANPEENQPELRQMVLNLAARVAVLEKSTGITTEPELPNGSEYETWQPWDGISSKYQYGAIVYHPGTDKLWESIFEGHNTWEPGTIGTEKLWREVTDDPS